MTCASVRECLQEHLEGMRHPLELASRLPDWVQRHLEGCPGCREASWQLVSLECSLRRLAESPPVPTDLSARVLAALDSEAPSPPNQDRRWMQAAAALLVALSVYGLTWLEIPVALGWSLLSGWTLPTLAVPGLSETVLAGLAAASLLGGTALNWRWSA